MEAETCLTSMWVVESLVGRVVETLAVGVRPDAVSAEDAAEILAVAGRLKDMCAGIETLFLARAAESPRFAPSGGESREDKVARATRRTTRAAKRAMATSKAANESPTLGDAMRRGDLSERQSEQIADATRHDPAAIPDLIGKAHTEDAKGLADACARVKAASEPDPDGQRARIHAKRKLSHWTDADGARCGFWKMTPEAAAEVEHVLDAYTNAEFKRARAEGRREPFEAYRADGLLRAMRAAAGGSADDVVPVRKELVIRVDHSAFTRGHTHPGEVCEIRGLGPVPVSVAREIAADAFLKALFHDGTEIKLVKHHGRHIPAELRTALLDKHQVCVDPGCNRCQGLELDHFDPVAQGGETSSRNVGPKCKPGHKAKTRTDNARTRAMKDAGTLPPRPPPRPTRRARAAPNERVSGEPPPDQLVPTAERAPDPPSGVTLFDAAQRDADPTPADAERAADVHTTWRQVMRDGGPPPDCDPFSDEGVRYR